ncbi:1061_t:CDS:2 [Gigaspora margarita]|uniref:1061_t:CDS:1 n=1 Tax=Gigaspora margarita TaxID=4874 RepID=A0ABN7V7J8_GIGMA|nr:1061_t:CDS:2 [Gigaspora margarita]
MSQELLLLYPNDNSTCISLYSIWVEIKTLTTINNKNFIITVVQNEFKPGYICHSDGIYSEICENSTIAITSVYQRIFFVATKHTGPLIIGFDQHIISDQLLSDITFCFFSFKLDKLNLLIFGYKSSFIWNYQNSRALFVQEFKNKKIIVQVYQAIQEVAIFKNTSSNTVWQQIGILSQYTELELFGLAHKTIYKAIKEIPSCTILDWNNEIFEKVF